MEDDCFYSSTEKYNRCTSEVIFVKAKKYIINEVIR